MKNPAVMPSIPALKRINLVLNSAVGRQSGSARRCVQRDTQNLNQPGQVCNSPLFVERRCDVTGPVPSDGPTPLSYSTTRSPWNI